MPSRGFPALVAEVLDPYQVIINRGSIDQVKLNDRFLMYELTKEIVDPETQESLGRLQVSKGTGRVVQVQERMAVIYSDRTDDNDEEVPFNEPKRGDMVKYI